MALLQVKVADHELKQLKQLALDKDVTVSTLVRDWITQIVGAVDRVGK